MPGTEPPRAGETHWLALGNSTLAVRMTASDARIGRMEVVTAVPSGAPSVDTPWAEVNTALARWPNAAFAGYDWTGHAAFPPGGTRFQRAVWSELCALRPGETIGYGELAGRLGRPGAARAIGQAVGANPWAPLVPCHRVLAGDGSLGGYAGGLAIKADLLALEGIHPGAG